MGIITGVEVNFVVKDSLEALALYEKVFDVERIEASDNPKGQNEAIFFIYGTRLHILDENPEFYLESPKEGQHMPMWLNVAVLEIGETFQKAIDAGFKQIAPITDMPDFGVKNAVLADPFGYIWMLHQIDRIVTHEKRVELLKK